MSTAFTAAELRDKLPEVLAALKPGERIVIDQGGQTFTLAADRRPEPTPFREPLIAPRHWDAMPFCYGVSGVVGIVFYSVGWPPIVGVLIGFAAAVLVTAAVFTAVKPDLEGLKVRLTADYLRELAGFAGSGSVYLTASLATAWGFAAFAEDRGKNVLLWWPFGFFLAAAPLSLWFSSERVIRNRVHYYKSLIEAKLITPQQYAELRRSLLKWYILKQFGRAGLELPLDDDAPALIPPPPE